MEPQRWQQINSLLGAALDLLGRGGMGIVYKAEDETLSCTVALKRTSDRKGTQAC